jgi:hypothetical protein
MQMDERQECKLNLVMTSSGGKATERVFELLRFDIYIFITINYKQRYKLC